MRSLLRILPVVAILAATACRDSSTTGGDSATADVTPGGTLVISSPGDADMLIPGLSGSITGHQVIDLVFDRLAEIGDELNVIGDAGFRPRLAQRWTWGADSLSIAFALDPRARWHDGRPVRASDVRFTFDLHRSPSVVSPVLPDISSIDSVTVRDSLTAVFWFGRRGPMQFFEAVQHLPIMPEHVYGSAAGAKIREAESARRPVGSGRFRFVTWEPGTRLELVADTANYRGRALLDRVLWTFVADPTTALARIRAGEADFFEGVPPAQAAALDSVPGIRVFSYPAMQYAFMGMNLNARRNGAGPHPVFGDIRVRRALTMATDRAAMLENVFAGLGKASHAPLPKALGVADSLVPQVPFDTAAAAALLDSAGWRMGQGGIRQKDGRALRFSLLVPQSSAARMAYAVLLQEQFRRIGAQVDIETMDFATFVNRSNARDYDAALQGWGQSDPGAGAFRGRWSAESAGSGGTNVEGYRNPTMDAYVDSALAAYDARRASQFMERALRQITADAPAIWLYEPVSVAAAHERIRMPALRGDKWWAHLADWYVPEAQRTERDRIGLRPAPTP